MKDSVKAGKVDCDSQPQVCQQAGIRSYPTVRLYQKPKHGSKKVRSCRKSIGAGAGFC